MTKILFVSGDDYAALAFEEKYKGQLVSDILPKLDLILGEKITKEEGYVVEVDYRVKEYDVVANDSLLYYLQEIREIGNRDQLRHENHYPENAIVGKLYRKPLQPLTPKQ